MSVSWCLHFGCVRVHLQGVVILELMLLHEAKGTSVPLHLDVRTNDFNEFPQVTCSHTKHITWDCALAFDNDSSQQRQKTATATMVARVSNMKKKWDDVSEYIYFTLSSSSSAAASACGISGPAESVQCATITPYRPTTVCIRKRHVRDQRYLLFMLMDMDELDTPRDSGFHLYPFAISHIASETHM